MYGKSRIVSIEKALKQSTMIAQILIQLSIAINIIIVIMSWEHIRFIL